MEKDFLALDTVVTCVFNYPQCFDAEEYAHLYTPLRRERIARASLASVKMQSAAAELAYLAARKLAGIGDGGACYSYAENGRPVISGGFISMTHTEGCGAAALSSVPVGVDAEKLRDLDLRIAQRMLIKDELAVLDRADDKPGTLLSYWTAKEACAKLSGEGIPALSRLSYDRGQGSVYDAASGKTYSVDQRRLALSNPFGEVLLAVCTERSAAHILAVFNDAEMIVAYVEAHGDSRNA